MDVLMGITQSRSAAIETGQSRQVSLILEIPAGPADDAVKHPRFFVVGGRGAHPTSDRELAVALEGGLKAVQLVLRAGGGEVVAMRRHRYAKARVGEHAS